MWMDMNERMLWLTDNMYSFQHGDVLMPELKTSLVSMKKTNQPHYQANSILSFGSMTNRHFMQMIVIRHDGYPRTKQQCLSQREKVLHRWWLTWSVQTMGGCTLMMERRKSESSSRLVKTGRVISLTRTF